MSNEPRPVNRTLLAIGGGFSAFSLLVGLSMAFGSLKWLIAMEEQPIEPPGQMVGIIPIAGIFFGGLLGIMGVFGLWAVQRLWRRKSNGTMSGSRNEPS
ncbi:hypothetical protein BH11PLA2_BH11PLA2_33310 [soil metagenome]